MDEKEILASSLNKSEKARKLFDLGKTNKEVADLILKGNVGWAFNIRKNYNEKKLADKSAPLEAATGIQSPEKSAPKLIIEKAGAQKTAVPTKPVQKAAQKTAGAKKPTSQTKEPAKAVKPAAKKVVAKSPVTKKTKTSAKTKPKPKPRLGR